MNTFLLSLIDKRIDGLMIRFSQLPVKPVLLFYSQNEILVKMSKKLLDTYIHFLQAVGIAPKEYSYCEKPIVKKLSILAQDNQHLDDVEKKLINLITVPLTPTVIPVNIHVLKSGQLILYTGIGIAETTDTAVSFFLYELSISTVLIKHTPIYLHYLDSMLACYSPDEFPSLRKLPETHNKKNYNQFQNDCREYFGDTFYQFHNKMKMLDALEDIMLSELSLKNIASTNNFRSYNNMYFLFCIRYKFPIDSIPRLFKEI
ncbi:hypothetical protein M2347_003919 [Chryseobacterium sp. H1D6B]|uniref:hypothetical protein n=1 Tax=Chryseobacterium sp. H1D6B TaxID=2940588 RepID=UPI0015C932FE|nr:hypothetical protein [Chryseobacterium sp. H1D6B]MDH6254192.1 hypothetical protein [Chryseobacterium sp. H1D6B]